MKKRVMSILLCCLMVLQLAVVGGIAVNAETQPSERLYTYNADKTKVIHNGKEYAVTDHSITVDGTTWKLVDTMADMANMLDSSTNYLFMNDISVFDGKKEITVNDNVSLMDYALTNKTGNTKQFKGMIEGNGYAITGCDVKYTNNRTSGSVYFSLFYYAGKSIRNLSFGTAEAPIRFDITIPNDTNGAMAVALVSPIMNSGSAAVWENIDAYCDIDINAPGVSNCFIAPFYSRNYSGKADIEMYNVETYGTIDVTASGIFGVGGICGTSAQKPETVGGNFTLTNCTNNINITASNSAVHANATATFLVGGVMAGYSTGVGHLTLTSCLNNGNISFTGVDTHGKQSVGGVVGSANTTNQTLVQCFNTGTVTATDTNLVGTTVTPAEAAYKLGKRFGYKLDGSEGAPAYGNQNYVTYDYNQKAYINTENVLSVDDSEVKNFSAQIQFAKTGDVNKLRFIIVSTKEAVEELGNFEVVLTFQYGTETKTVKVPNSGLSAYRSVKAADEMYYAEYGQCLLGLVVTNIPEAVLASGSTVTAELVPASGGKITLGNATW